MKPKPLSSQVNKHDLSKRLHNPEVLRCCYPIEWVRPCRPVQSSPILTTPRHWSGYMIHARISGPAYLKEYLDNARESSWCFLFLLGLRFRGGIGDLDVGEFFLADGTNGVGI